MKVCPFPRTFGGAWRLQHTRSKVRSKMKEEARVFGIFLHTVQPARPLPTRQGTSRIITIARVVSATKSAGLPSILACFHLHKCHQKHGCPFALDIARIAALGVKVYSFSIPWSRVMPFRRGPVNEQALAHYDDVIGTCIKIRVLSLILEFDNVISTKVEQESVIYGR